MDVFLQTCRGAGSLGKTMSPHVSDLLLFKTYEFSNIRRRKRKVKTLNIPLTSFQSFSLPDLQTLKEDRQWFSDTHVTFCLL
jgi:hypothetical protein